MRSVLRPTAAIQSRGPPRRVHQRRDGISYMLCDVAIGQSSHANIINAIGLWFTSCLRMRLSNSVERVASMFVSAANPPCRGGRLLPPPGGSKARVRRAEGHRKYHLRGISL